MDLKVVSNGTLDGTYVYKNGTNEVIGEVVRFELNNNDSKKTFQSFGILEYELKNHKCTNKLWLPTDKPEKLRHGWTCNGCGMVYEIRVSDIDPNHSIRSNKESRIKFDKMINGA